MGLTARLEAMRQDPRLEPEGASAIDARGSLDVARDERDPTGQIALLDRVLEGHEVAAATG